MMLEFLLVFAAQLVHIISNLVIVACNALLDGIHQLSLFHVVVVLLELTPLSLVNHHVLIALLEHILLVWVQLNYHLADNAKLDVIQHQVLLYAHYVLQEPILIQLVLQPAFNALLAHTPMQILLHALSAPLANIQTLQDQANASDALLEIIPQLVQLPALPVLQACSH